MTKFYSSLLSFIMLCCVTGLSAQDTLWIEDFTPYADTTGVIGSETGPVNGGDYPGGVTKWTLDASNATLENTSDYAMVRTVNEEKLFDWRDVEGGVIMTTESIDISGVDTAAFSIEFEDDGDFEPADYIDVSYSVNGGAFTLITNYAGLGSETHTIIGDIPDDDDWIAVTIIQEELIGTSLVIKIEVASNSGSEFVKMDNITVVNASGFEVDPCLNANIVITGEVVNESEAGENDGEIDITVVGGTEPYEALWNDGSTDGDREDLEPGTYSVTITDTFGCTGMALFDILPGVEPLEGDTVWCEDFEPYADSTGFIGDDVGAIVPTGDYPGGVTKWTLNTSVAGMEAPTDHFMVRNLGSSEEPDQALDARDVDGDGATWTSETIDISEYDEIGFSLTIEDDGDHESSDFVDVAYSIDGGEFTLVENWNGLGSSTHTLVGDIPDDDDWLFTTVQVTELSGASLQLRIELLNNSGSEFIRIDNICVIGDDIGPDPCDGIDIGATATITDETVLGEADGAIDITVTGNGTADYTFSWNNGSTDEDISGLAGGDYTVTITDANDCTGEETFTVEPGTDPCAGVTITVSGVVTDESELDANDGAIDVTVTGGTGTFTYSWSNGSTDEDLTNLEPGEYTLIASDGNDCTGTNTFTVQEGPDPCDGVTITITGVVTDESSAGAGDGAIDITVSGGTPDYTYSWSNGSTDEDISSLDPANYSVLVTDAEDCINEVTFTVDPGPSAVNEIASLKVFDVYPNPATAQFNIQLQLDRVEEIQLFIINPVGSVVYESSPERIQSKTYSIQNEWGSGIYFLEIRSADGVAVKQLILMD